MIGAVSVNGEGLVDLRHAEPQTDRVDDPLVRHVASGLVEHLLEVDQYLVEDLLI